MSLQYINLRNLRNLTDLYLKGCESLRSVDISGCRSMKKLSGHGYIPLLEELDVSSCPLIRSCLNYVVTEVAEIGHHWMQLDRRIDQTGMFRGAGGAKSQICLFHPLVNMQKPLVRSR